MHKILTVDDVWESSIITKRTLKKLDCKVTEFTDARAALKLLELANVFDVIFVDYVMPAMNGIEFLEAVKAIRPETPVILYSNNDNPTLEDEALSKGAVCCILGKQDITKFKTALDKALTE